MSIEDKRTSPLISRAVDTLDGLTAEIPVFLHGKIQNVDGAYYARYYLPQIIETDKIRLYRDSDARGLEIYQNVQNFKIAFDFDIDIGDFYIVNRHTSNKLANIFTQTTPVKKSIYLWFNWSDGTLTKQLDLNFSEPTSEVKYFSQYNNHLYVLREVLDVWYVHYYNLDNFVNKSVAVTATRVITVTANMTDILAGRNYFYTYIDSGGSPIIQIKRHDNNLVIDTWTDPLLGDLTNKYPVHMMEISDLDIYLRKRPSSLYRITNGTSELQSNTLNADDDGNFRIMNMGETYIETIEKLINPFEGYEHKDVWYLSTKTNLVQFYLYEIFAQIAQELKFDYDVLDLTDITDKEFYGLIIDSEYSLSRITQLLRAAYFLDYSDSGIFKVLSRSSLNDRKSSIETDDLGVFVGSQLQYQTIKNTENSNSNDTPDSIMINYSSTEKDHLSRTQTISIALPNKKSLTLELLPFSFSDSQAMQIAEKTFVTIKNEQIIKSDNTFIKYLNIDSADAITFDNEPNATYRVNYITLNAFPAMLNIQYSPDNPDNYSSELSGSATEDGEQTITVVEFPVIYLLDLPLLPNDIYIDDFGYYLLARKSGNNDFPVSSLWKNITGSWNNDGSLSEIGITGVTDYKLESHTWKIVDTVNTLRIILNDSTNTLSTVTDDEFYTYNNLAAIINPDNEIEIIKFKNAVEVIPGTYDIDTLIRGYLGTENAINTHTATDTFVLLSDVLRQVSFNIESEGQYIGVPDETIFPKTNPDDDVYDIVISFLNSNRVLQPYAVLDLAANKSNNDIVFTGTNRGRYGNDTWQFYIDNSLTDTGTNEIDIYYNSTVIRTLTGTFPIVYSESQQVADFGAIVGSLTVDVYAMNSKIGRGVRSEYNFVGID